MNRYIDRCTRNCSKSIRNIRIHTSDFLKFLEQPRETDVSLFKNFYRAMKSDTVFRKFKIYPLTFQFYAIIIHLLFATLLILSPYRRVMGLASTPFLIPCCLFCCFRVHLSSSFGLYVSPSSISLLECLYFAFLFLVVYLPTFYSFLVMFRTALSMFLFITCILFRILTVIVPVSVACYQEHNAFV